MYINVFCTYLTNILNWHSQNRHGIHATSCRNLYCHLLSSGTPKTIPIILDSTQHLQPKTVSVLIPRPVQTCTAIYSSLERLKRYETDIRQYSKLTTQNRLGIDPTSCTNLYCNLLSSGTPKTIPIILDSTQHLQPKTVSVLIPRPVEICTAIYSPLEHRKRYQSY